MSSDQRIPPAGDPFTLKPDQPAAEQERLARLEEKYLHELLTEDERCELRDRIVRLRRRLRLGVSR